MHSKIQYLAAANLWDTLLSEKYRGIKATLLVHLLFDKAGMVGLHPNEYYDYACSRPDGDGLFQAQMRYLMDEQARDKGLDIRPEDQFQMLGSDGAGTGPWVGSSQLAQWLDDEEYIFSLQMTETHLSLHVIAANREIAHADRMVFKLDLSPPIENKGLFYRSSFVVHERFLPFQSQIVKLLGELIPKAQSFEFQYAISRWHVYIRDALKPM